MTLRAARGARAVSVLRGGAVRAGAGADRTRERRGARWPALGSTSLIALPPLVFAGFAAVAFFALKRENPDELPSALTGRAAPGLAAATPLGADPPPTDAACAPAR